MENQISGIKTTRWIPLINKDGQPVETLSQAVEELKRLRTKRADNALSILQRMPKFADYAKRYTDFTGSGQGAKKPGTLEKEKTILARWVNKLGDLRIDQIKRIHINRFVEGRMKENVSPRTINLDVIVFRIVMKRALSEGLIQRLPTEGLQPLKVTTISRSLFTSAQLEKICEAAFQTKKDKNGKTVPKATQEIKKNCPIFFAPEIGGVIYNFEVMMPRKSSK